MLSTLRTRLMNGLRNLRTILLILGVAVVFIGGTGSPSGALVRNIVFVWLGVWALRRFIRSRRRGSRAMREFDAQRPGRSTSAENSEPVAEPVAY
jgi:hypothetical protein